MAKIDLKLANGKHILEGKNISMKTYNEAKALVGHHEMFLKTASGYAVFVKNNLIIATITAHRKGAILELFNKGL